MSGASLRYLIKEGFRNTWTNRMMSIASICVLLSCLVLIGSASMMFLNVNSLVDRIGDENVIMVFIEDSAGDEQIEEMRTSLKSIDNIQKIVFVPKEKAWKEQLATMEDAHAKFFTETTGDIPLPNAFKVTVKDLSIFTETVKEIKKLDNIETIRQNTEVAKKLDTISHGITIIAIAIIAILFVISLFIISNTIKLTVYSRRLEISIMKSVGATNGFVQLPFVVEGCILGLIAGVVSLGAVWGLYEVAIRYADEVFKSINLVPLQFTDYALQMLGVFVAIGIVSGVGGSLIAMRRYLTKEGSEISAV